MLLTGPLKDALGTGVRWLSKEPWRPGTLYLCISKIDVSPWSVHTQRKGPMFYTAPLAVLGLIGLQTIWRSDLLCFGPVLRPTEINTMTSYT